jgi:hypothetical protein
MPCLLSSVTGGFLLETQKILLRSKITEQLLLTLFNLKLLRRISNPTQILQSKEDRKDKDPTVLTELNK